MAANIFRDAEHRYLALDEPDEDPMNQLQRHSITYRIAAGPHQGRKVFTLQTLPGTKEPFIADGWPVSRCTPAWRSFIGHCAVSMEQDLPAVHKSGL